MLKSKLSENLILFCIILLLSALYIVSFPVKNKNNDKRTIIKTEIINEKNKSKIEKFEITKDNKTLVLSRLDDFWSGSEHVWLASEKDMNNYIPCDVKFINSFINDMIKLRSLYKISDSFDKNNAYFDEEICTIRYYLEGGKFYEVYFGKQDFAFSSRYFKSDASDVVFQMDNSLDKYLSASVQIWSDPYLVSRAIMQEMTGRDVQRILVKDRFGTKTMDPLSEDFSEKARKLLELRHGGFKINSGNLQSESDLTLTFEFGNKWEAELSFYPTNDPDNDYNIKAVYKIPEINKTFIFETKISAWTYNKISEMTL